MPTLAEPLPWQWFPIELSRGLGPCCFLAPRGNDLHLSKVNVNHYLVVQVGSFGSGAFQSCFIQNEW